MTQILGNTDPNPPWYQDPVGLVFNELSKSFIGMIVVGPVMACLGEVDPLNLVLPTPTGILQQGLHFSLRYFLGLLAVIQTTAMLFSLLPILMGLMYCKACIEYLKSYKPRLASSVHQENSGLSHYSDLQLYRAVHVVFQVARKFSDRATVFVTSSGFICIVTCNYVVVMLYDKIPLLLYITIVVTDLSMLTMISVGVPLTRKIHSRSGNLIQCWKQKAKRRRSYRQKTVDSFRPVEIWVGSFFVVKGAALFDFAQEILNKTIDFILLV